MVHVYVVVKELIKFRYKFPSLNPTYSLIMNKQGYKTEEIENQTRNYFYLNLSVNYSTSIELTGLKLLLYICILMLQKVLHKFVTATYGK